MQEIIATATVVRRDELAAGSIYKRLVEKYGSTYEVHIGVVLDAMHNADGTAALTALEIDKGYNSTPTIEVFGPKSSMDLFPASEDETMTILLAAEEVAASAVESAHRALEKATRNRGLVQTVRRAIESK